MPKTASVPSRLPLEETKIRLRAETFADHYSHARLFYRSQTEIEQAHLASAIVFELSKVTLNMCAIACSPIWAMSTRRSPPVSPMV